MEVQIVYRSEKFQLHHVQQKEADHRHQALTRGAKLASLPAIVSDLLLSLGKTKIYIAASPSGRKRPESIH